MMELRFWFLAIFLVLGEELCLADVSGNQTKEIYPEYCTTFDNKPGKCVDYRQCPYILDIVAKMNAKVKLTPRETEIFKHCLCSEKSKTIVCCEESINDSGLEVLRASEPVCGVFGDNKVTGGNEIRMGSRPWMVLLKYDIQDAHERTAFKCGGTLITSRYILTAAHCILDSLITIRLGEHKISTERDCETYGSTEVCLPPYQDVSVENYVVHEGYDNITLHYDIALVRLARSVEFSKFIKPICLPLHEEVRQSIWNNQRPNQKVTGWGITEGDMPSDVPKEASVRRLTLDQCNHDRNISLIGNQLCVSAYQQDSCKGDSGGPLLFPYLYLGQQRFVQTGIVSKGPRDCGAGSSAIYTDVTRFVPWITQNIRA
ncbi:serine protease grass-like [Drosophila eugracilis]|uniref:serine protease grass-like n=1 Tax=Drosophila eugracilis TaxID=29029 RepID=UPI0007E67FE8|nr:serine protease grass-like [Drosophila eugracilis]